MAYQVERKVYLNGGEFSIGIPTLNNIIGYDVEQELVVSNNLSCNSLSIFTNIDKGIIDVNIIVPNKVVEVTFADNTKEKAVCREPDVFSLEQAIAICISKKVMGGSSKYNKAVKAGMKVCENKLKDEETKRLQAEREEMIEIQKEAYLRAMKEINNDEHDKEINDEECNNVD